MAVKCLDHQTKKYRVAFWFRHKRYTKVVYGSRQLAGDLEAKMRAKLIEGVFFPERNRRSYSMGEILKAYLEQERPHRGPVPYEDLERRCRYIEEYFGSRRLLEQITPVDVQGYRNALSQRMGLMAVNRCHSQLRRVFNWATSGGMFHGDNPASSRRVKIPSDRKHWRKDFLSEEEAKRLVDCAHPRLRPIILTALFSAMRKGELVAMRKKDVNLDHRNIMLPDSKNGEPGWVPINDTLFKVLEPLVRAAPNPESPVLDFSYFRQLWGQAKKKAGLEKYVFHSLRHTAASWLVLKTGSLIHAQHLLRHRTQAMTGRYVHLAKSDLRQAVIQLDQVGLNPTDVNTAEIPIVEGQTNIETNISDPPPVPPRIEI